MQIKNIKRIRKSNRIVLVVILLSFLTNTFSQNISNDHNIIYNYVTKNIIYYKLLHSTDLKESGLDNYFKIASYLPDSGYYLQIEINKIDWTFPLSDYSLYSIVSYGWTFVKTEMQNCTTSVKEDSIKILSTQTFSISTNDEVTPPYNPNMYLVAYNNKKNKIIFISGEFYTSPISSIFSLNIKNPEIFIPYLKCKLYNNNVKDISFLKRKRNKIYFKIKYNTNEIGYVEMKKDNFESIKIYSKYPRGIFEKAVE